MEKILSHIRNLGVNALNLLLGLVPVLATFHFPRHAALIARKALLMLAETVQWSQERAIAEGGEALRIAKTMAVRPFMNE